MFSLSESVFVPPELAERLLGRNERKSPGEEMERDMGTHGQGLPGG